MTKTITTNSTQTASHTLGAWRNKPDAIQTDEGIEVAYMASVGDYAMTEANARLMALSPELLDALEDCYEALWRLVMVTDISTRGGDVVDYYHLGKAARDKAKALIAKARGE